MINALNVFSNLKRKIPGAKEPEVLSLDVSSSVESYKSKLDLLIVKHGCINILINNAGISYRGEVSLWLYFKFIVVG
jgi:short-subunit dehydrogenase